MKVLILANFGMGLYKFRRELIESLIDKKNEVILAYPKDEYVSSFIEMGCKFINTNVDRRGMNPIKDISLLYKYIKLLKELKPDVVLTYTIKPNIYGGLACQVTNTRYITTITGLGSALENQGIIRKFTLGMYKIALRSSQSVFFQNKRNKSIFKEERLLKGASQIVPGSGVNLSEYKFELYPPDLNSIKLVFIGRIMRDKGINELLEAITIIKEKYNHVDFSLIGFCEEEYEVKLNKMEEQGLLTYHGKQRNVIPYIHQANAVILPSYHEGLSNVLLESAAIGRPVIASNIPGCRETYDDNVTGLSIEIKNVNSLVEAIEKFINLPYKEKLLMGNRARAKIEEQFDRKIVISKYINEIEKVGK